MHVTPFEIQRLFSWFTGFLDAGLKPAMAAIQINALLLANEQAPILLQIALAAAALFALLGWSSAPVGGYVAVALKGGIVAAVLTASFWNDVVRDFVTVALPAAWTKVVSFGSTDTGPAAPFDAIFNQTVAAGLDVWRRLWPSPLIVWVVFFFLTALAAIGCGYAVWLAGYFSARMYVSIGPIFVVLGMFTATRPIFLAWIGVLASAVVLQLLAVTLASVLVGSMRAMLGALTSGVFGGPQAQVVGFIGAAVIFALCAWKAYQLPGVASALCGGVYWHPGAIVNATYGAIGKGASNLLGMAGPIVAEGGKRAADKVRERLRHGDSRPGPSISPSPGPSLSRVQS